MLSKRGRCTIEKEMRLTFDSVLHLIDSATVLCMINKLSTRFRLYEGVRIGEIQAATDGNLTEWKWIAGKENCADWITRGLSPQQIDSTSEWWNGPKFLYQDHSLWDVKCYDQVAQKKDILPGEKKMVKTNLTSAKDCIVTGLFERVSSAKTIKWILARVFSVFKHKSFKGGATSQVTVEDLKASQLYLVKQAQVEVAAGVKGQYKNLNPKVDDRGVWTIGSRMSQYNPI